MPDMTLDVLSEKMKKIDFAMLSTITDGGLIASRPMSNNGEVDYDGDSWFFTYETTRTIRDVTSEPKVELGFSGDKSLLGKPGIFISVQGSAEIIKDKGQFESHWTTDLERWFPQGIDTPGMVLLKVHATRIHYWDGEDEGEVAV
jgi:general stress protein 26